MADAPDMSSALANAVGPDNQYRPDSLSAAAAPTTIPSPVADRAPASAPTSQGPINVIDPTGELVSIDPAHLQEALASGFQQPTPEQVDQHFKEEKYGTLGQQLKAGAEGFAEANTFGLSTKLEKEFGIAKPEDIEGRRDTGYGHMVGQGAGLLTSALTGVGEAKVLEKAGEGAARLAGLANASAPLAKIGSAIVKGAAENAIFQAGDEASKAFSTQLGQPADISGALANIGLSGLIGGGVGGAIGAASPLWKATLGGKTTGVLKAITDHVGGQDVVSDSVRSAIDKSGMDLSPEVVASLSDNPRLQQFAKELEQTDSNGTGKEFQGALMNFRKASADAMAEAMGKAPGDLPVDLSKYESGKKIGNQLAEEYDAQIGPAKQMYESQKSNYGRIELPKDEVSEIRTETPNPYAPNSEEVTRNVRPGAVTKITDDLGQLAQREQWLGSPDSDVMKLMTRTIKNLKPAQTIEDLSSQIKDLNGVVGKNAGFGGDKELYVAAGKMNGIIKEAQADLVGRAVGSEEGAEAAAKFAEARKAYAAQARVRDAIDGSLGAKGSVSGYAKAVKDLALTDGEHVINRLANNKDAYLLEVLQKNFPKTSDLVKQYHIDSILKQGLDKAKAGELLNSTAIRSAIDKMSPELKNFVFTGEQLGRMDAVGQLLDQYNKIPHNFSNTARVAEALHKGPFQSAIGMVTAVTTHNPLLAAVTGPLARYIGKDAPDAMKLALLKFLGSNKHIDAEGFKAAVEFAHATIKGENLMGSAAKNVFKTGVKVLPESAMPSANDRRKLDKSLQQIKEKPDTLLNAGGKTGHYLPDHAAEIGSTAAAAANFLNGIRPQTSQRSPLDTKIPPSPMQQAAYDRALNIAQQPLVVLEHMKNGTLVPSDLVALKTMYPSVYANISGKLQTQMVNAIDRGDTVPYQTRMGLSMFIGQALDSTMLPASIIAAQPQPSHVPQQGGQEPAPKHTATALNKLASSYRTADQTAQQDRSQGRRD